MPAAASLGNPRHRRLIPRLDIHDLHALDGQALPSDLAGWNSDHHSLFGRHQQLVILGDGGRAADVALPGVDAL